MKKRTKPAEWVGRKPDDPQPIFYQGCHVYDVPFFREAGWDTFCFSYFYPADVDTDHLSKLAGCRICLDSGAFSFLTDLYTRKRLSTYEVEQRAEAYLLDYASYARSRPYPFDFHITFDYKVEASLVYQVTERLGELGILPVAVYHGDSSVDWLKRYINDGHKLVCLSKRFFLHDRNGLRKFYDQCFAVTQANGVACHGLACTGNEMWEYPWYSMDSSTASQAGFRGELIYSAGSALQRVCISRKRFRGHLPDALRAEIDARDLDVEELLDGRDSRIRFNALTYKKFVAGRTNKCQTKKTLF
jgi:hypothetical protein